MPDNNGLNNSDVNSVISFFKKVSGFQISNRFKISIDPPQQLGLVPPPLFATMVQVPGQVVNYFSDNLSPSANTIDIPVKREYDNRFIIDFIIDKNWNCRQFFESWLDLIFVDGNSNFLQNKGSKLLNYWDNIVGRLNIYALDQNSNINKTIILYGAWPATIQPTQFMNDSANNYLTMTVDINYRYYTIT